MALPTDPNFACRVQLKSFINVDCDTNTSTKSLGYSVVQCGANWSHTRVVKSRFVSPLLLASRSDLQSASYSRKEATAINLRAPPQNYLSKQMYLHKFILAIHCFLHMTTVVLARMERRRRNGPPKAQRAYPCISVANQVSLLQGDQFELTLMHCCLVESTGI